MDILEYNRKAWNTQSAADGEWSIPVSPEIVKAAREGQWEVILTPQRPVPRDWFGELPGKEVLCLASGGGQQVPILAAAGARVTSFDLSDVQLQKDRSVAEREQLNITCIRGDMADLSALPPDSFDLIFHPVSNCFVPDVEVVWRECFRVLRPGGELLAAFINPSFFLFDHDESIETGKIEVTYSLPFAEPDSLDEKGRELLAKDRERPVQFSHSLETQLGGQLKAGFVICDLYEDYWDDSIPLNAYAPSYIATRSKKGG